MRNRIGNFEKKKDCKSITLVAAWKWISFQIYLFYKLAEFEISSDISLIKLKAVSYSLFVYFFDK